MASGSGTAVTGLGCLCALGLNAPACLDGLFHRRPEPGPASRAATTHRRPIPVFELPGEFFEPPWCDAFAAHNLTTRLALFAAREALTDAGWDLDELGGLRVGVAMGTTVGAAMNSEPFYREFRRGGAPDMAPIERFLAGNPADAVSRTFALSGPCQTVVNACSSGTDAVGIAASWIEQGLCDVALAGGADELCRVTVNGFTSLMITDEAPCRPFDVSRKGLNLGEGAAMLVLESPAVASRRGRSPRARVLGYGCACDAHHLTAPHPEGRGLRAAVTDALHRAGIGPDAIAFVNAHGTGTRDNDRVEGLVLSQTLPDVPFLSTKGATGHTLGAAGAIEAVLTIGCLEAGRIPASPGFETPDPDCRTAPVAEESAVSGRAALSQSLAFGGSNAALVLGLD